MAKQTNSYQDYQDAQSQLLNIQAQQQANLQEARLMGQSQMATNNVLNQAAQVAAQTVAMGNTTQPATFNPTTQAVLQQYGLGQPRVVTNQTRNQSTTPQHVTINNNTSNITNNNVSVPANIGGPIQGRPVQINPDVQMGTFKTWLSNVFAQQNAEVARRDREYERRESALNRNSNKLLKKIGEIGGNIGKALDPRRATSSSVNTIKTLFTVLGIAKLAKNWDVIAEKLDNITNFFTKKDSEDGGEKSFFNRMRETIVHILGGQSEGENAEGVLTAFSRLLYNPDKSNGGGGIFNQILDRIKIELDYRFKAAGLSLDKYKEGIKSSGKGIEGYITRALDKLVGALGAMINGFVTGDAGSVLNTQNDASVDERHQYDFMDVDSFDNNRRTFTGKRGVSQYGSRFTVKTNDFGDPVIDDEGNPIIIEETGFDDRGRPIKREGTGFTFDNTTLATDRNGKPIGGMIEATWAQQDKNNPNVFVQRRELINPASLEINNMDMILPNTSQSNISAGGKANNLNHAINLTSEGDLSGDTAAFNASLDVIQILINQAAGKTYDYNKVVSYLQKIDRYLSKDQKKYVPVCHQWPEFFPKKDNQQYEIHYYKLVPASWNVNLRQSPGAPSYDQSTLLNPFNGALDGIVPGANPGKDLNSATWGYWAGKSGIGMGQLNQFKNNYTHILYLVPAASKLDIGIDGVVYPCYTITRNELLDVINRYMNLTGNNKVEDLQGAKFQAQMRRAMYKNTADNIRNDKNFNQQYTQKMNDLSELESLRTNYESALKEHDEEVYRQEQIMPRLKETDIGKLFGSLDEKAKEYINEANDLITQYKTKSEFIENLRGPIVEAIRSNYEGLSESEIDRYADVLLSHLALESGWGRHQAGNNNFGGIKAAKGKDGKPLDPKHAKEFWTIEILNDGLDKNKHLKDRVAKSYPFQMVNGKWKYKIRDYFKTYDTVNDFINDYISQLKNNWPTAIQPGVEDYSDKDLARSYTNALKHGGRYGSYFTADEERYTKSLSDVYSNIQKIKERMVNEQEIDDNDAVDVLTKGKSYKDPDGKDNTVIPEMNIEQSGKGEGADDPHDEEYIDKDNNPTNTYDNVVPNDNKFSTFDVNKAVNTLRENTNWEIDAYGKKLNRRDNPNKGYGMCARHVMVALRSGGVKISGVNHASQFLDDQSVWPKTGKVIAGKKDGIALINEDGFQEIFGDFQPGDVSIEESVNPYGSIDPKTGKKMPNTMGHMAMWDGSQWISDFKQRSSVVHAKYPGKIHYFRYVGRKVNDGIVTSNGSSSYSSDLGQYKKEFEDDLLSRFTTALNDFTARSRESNVENQNIGQGDSNNSEDYKEILSMLAQILNSQNSIAFNTAATADEVRANTQVTAQQINRPVETRTSTNSMLSNRSNSNYGG